MDIILSNRDDNRISRINQQIEETGEDDKKLEGVMKQNYSYPAPSDPNFQTKIFEKREFYYHRIPGRDELKSYQDIKDYRARICTRKVELLEQQSFLSNFINPDTPYRGILVFHGTGTGENICQSLYL